MSAEPSFLPDSLAGCKPCSRSYVWSKASWERGRPGRTMPRHSLGHLRHSDRPGTAPGVSLGLAVEVHTDRLAACQVVLTLSDLHKGIRMRAGRPRSRGDLLPLMGWGDGRVGAGDRYFFMNIDAQDFFRKRLACIPGNPQSPTAPSPGPASGATTSRPVYPVRRC